MKKSYLKLTQFSKAELNQRMMNALRGGTACNSCQGCYCTGSTSVMSRFKSRIKPS